MNKNKLRNKYVYIDIDGTLAEYRFNNHLSAKDGTGNGQSMSEIENHVFLNSRPLKTMNKLLAKSKSKGIWICGAIVSPIELEDKIKWLNKYYSNIDLSGYFWFVTDEYWGSFLEYFNCTGDYDIVTKRGIIIKGTKNIMWNWIVKHNMCKLEDTIFIDDVLQYLRFAEEKGVSAYHISSFMK